MSLLAGKSVRLFLVDGSPTGVVTAEIVNWTGHALLAPRADLALIRKRAEFQRTGVYFLLGEVATLSERRKVYVGESDDVGRRIEQHASSKDDDFFERFCVFTNKDANLTKSHARYLESRLTSIARSSGRTEVLNANNPPAGTLPESDIADMEFFISQIELILPVLGFDILRKTTVPAKDRAENGKPIHQGVGVESSGVTELYLTDRKSGVQARALLGDTDYVVLEGSTARLEPKRSLEEHLGTYFALRESLIEDGSLVPIGNGSALLRFARNVVFKSPSAASAVILGRSDNGRRTWRVASTNEVLADFQERLLKEASR